MPHLNDYRNISKSGTPVLRVRTFLYVSEGLQQSVLVARNNSHIDALLCKLACDLEAYAMTVFYGSQGCVNC